MGRMEKEPATNLMLDFSLPRLVVGLKKDLVESEKTPGCKDNPVEALKMFLRPRGGTVVCLGVSVVGFVD